MKPLKTSHQCLIWLCMCPAPDATTTRWQKTSYTICGFVVLISIISAFVANVMFFVRFISMDLEQSLFAVMFVAAQFGVIYMALSAIILKRQKIQKIFKDLTIIYENGKHVLKLKIDLKKDEVPNEINLPFFRKKC